MTFQLTEEMRVENIMAMWKRGEMANSNRVLPLLCKHLQQAWNEQGRLTAELGKANACLDWLQSKLTLHTGVEMAYVVDGYEVAIVSDLEPKDNNYFKSGTLADAIEAAILAEAKEKTE